MFEQMGFYVLLTVGVFYHLPRFIRWLWKAKYSDDSFYGRPDKQPDFLDNF